MTKVYLALGANVGDPAANIKQAIELLRPRLLQLKQAPIYASKPVGITDQPDFLNTAIGGQTELSPVELFEFIKDVEKRIGRIERLRWGPREIDIDIIFYGDQVINQPQLTVPHPLFQERDFVLQPLIDLNPDLIDPKSGHTVSQLLTKLTASGFSATITPYAEV
jgi:2-amino-4-hydroxy-6-hydroxymethyldihydropteridine diphosphokinase